MKDREFAVVLEGLRNDFKASSEGLSDVRQGLDDVHREVRETNKRLDETNRRLDETKQELTKLMQGVLTILDRHDISIEDLEKRVARLEQRAG